MSSNKAIACLACTILVLSAAAPAAAVDFPAVPVPEGSSGEVVSRHMVYNGLNMRASRFTVRQPLADVRAFYRGRWGTAMVETPLRGKTVLGHKAGDFYITVELQPSGGTTHGQVGITQVPPKGQAPSRGKGFALLPRTQVLEDIVYMDTPEQARTLNMRNTYSPFQNDRFYARTLRGKGYVRETDGAHCGASSARCVTRYVKGSSRMVLAYMRDATGTQVAAIIEQGRE